MDGSPATPVTRETRPPAAGPIDRYFSALNSRGVSVGAGAGVDCSCAPTLPTTSRHTRSGTNAFRMTRIVLEGLVVFACRHFSALVPLSEWRSYSFLSATIGSTLSARRDGM